MNVLYESPLDTYRRQIDAQMNSLIKGSELGLPRLYKQQLANVDSQYLLNLLLADWKFRATHQQHIVASIEGDWGTGKSLIAWKFKKFLSLLFKVPFKPEYIEVNPFKMLPMLQKGEKRQTYVQDERQRKSVGMLSHTMLSEWMDYIEQDRHTQKNLIHCSREIERSPATFKFKTRSPYMERYRNKICEQCKLFEHCSKTFTDTFCFIPFYKRSGYPLSFYVDLFMRRIDDDDYTVYYGTLSVPAPSIKEYLEYDTWKRKNIKRLGEGERGDYDILIQEAKQIYLRFKDRLIWKTRDKKLRPASTSEMKDIIYEEMLGKYPEKAVEMIVVRLKKLVIEEILKDNPKKASDFVKKYAKN